MTNINNIIEALEKLGGVAKLEDIYSQVNKMKKTPNPSIRRDIYLHASECDIYKEDNQDIFYAPEGKGKGIWGLRQHDLNKFPFKKGQKIKRKEVHQKLAGSNEGGICPTSHGDILIFSDPKVGEEFGYHDGWEKGSYMYYGAGQEGDMEFVRGNKAILNHRKNGQRIHLFFGAKGEVIYESQFELDEKDPFRLVEGKDKHDEARQAIIFKLNPINKYKSQLPKTNLDIASETKAEIVSQEAFENETSKRKQEEKIIISTRKESKLLEEYRKFRNKNGESALKRYRIKPKGQQQSLWTDGWDEDKKTLIEAKSSSSRNHIRLAIGQLLDYKRHIDPKPKKIVILLPTRPQDDLIDLVKGLKIELIFKEGGTFITL